MRTFIFWLVLSVAIGVGLVWSPLLTSNQVGAQTGKSAEKKKAPKKKTKKKPAKKKAVKKPAKKTTK
jgi:hypothetical protein